VKTFTRRGNVNTPTISTIIPAFNASRTIRRALDSVLAQTRPSDEILVVDDGSEDDLAGTLAPYDGCVTLIRQPNGGAASARNRGIDRSRGDYIAFLDADDYWEPDKLARQLAVFDAHPEIGLTSSCFYMQEPGQPRAAVPPGNARFFGRVLRPRGPVVFQVMRELWTTTTVLRRAALGSQRFDTSLSTAEDRDLWIRLITSMPSYLDPAPLATAVLEPGSLSRSNIDSDYTNMLQVVHRHRGLLGRRDLRRCESAVYRGWAASHLGQGRPHAARRPAWERLRRQFHSPEAWWICFKTTAIPRLARLHGQIHGGFAVAKRGEVAR
jgi:glycosyltransferase involved in cell wall biosynthesis